MIELTEGSAHSSRRPDLKAVVKRAWLRVLGPLVTAGLVVAAIIWYWNWMVVSGRVHRIILPEPSVVGERMVVMVQEDFFWADVRVTVGEIVLGFAIGFMAAVATAGVCVAKPFLGRVMAPYIVTFQAIPKVVLIPLVALWIDIGFQSSVVIVALVAFFPIYVSTDFGLRAVDPGGLTLLRSLKASRWTTFRMFRVPSALPHIFTGAKSAVNYSIVAAITAEFLGSREGLGYRIITMSSRLQLADLYAAVVVTAVVAGVVYGSFELLDRRLVYWRDR